MTIHSKVKVKNGVVGTIKDISGNYAYVSYGSLLGWFPIPSLSLL